MKTESYKDKPCRKADNDLSREERGGSFYLRFKVSGLRLPPELYTLHLKL